MTIFHSFLPMLRGFAEERMTDVWEVRRVTGLETDPLTGVDTPITEVVYTGKGRLQSFAGNEQTRDVIEHSSVVQRMSIHIPVGDYRPEVGDIAKCLSSKEDENLVGTEYRMVQSAPFKTVATAYRVFVDFKAA